MNMEINNTSILRIFGFKPISDRPSVEMPLFLWMKCLWWNLTKYMKLSVIFICILLLGACQYDHDFKNGQCVQMKLDGLKGTVIQSGRHNLMVRFSSIRERTNTHFLSKDGDIEKAPYATMLVRVFEVKHCE